MILGGFEIRKAFKSGAWLAYDLAGKCLNPEDLKYNPNSIDITLHNELKVCRSHVYDFKNPPTEDDYKTITINDNGFDLTHSEFVLGCAAIRFDCSRMLPHFDCNFFQVLHGKSTVGRAGLCVHATAGFGDYGFQGSFTFELFTVAAHAVRIYPGMRIAQIQFQGVINPQRYKGGYSGEEHYTQPVAPKGDRVFLK